MAQISNVVAIAVWNTYRDCIEMFRSISYPGYPTYRVLDSLASLMNSFCLSGYIAYGYISRRKPTLVLSQLRSVKSCPHTCASSIRWQVAFGLRYRKLRYKNKLSCMCRGDERPGPKNGGTRFGAQRIEKGISKLQSRPSRELYHHPIARW